MTKSANSELKKSVTILKYFMSEKSAWWPSSLSSSNFTLQSSPPRQTFQKNMQCSLHIYEYRCERYVPFRILWRAKAPCFFMFWLSLNARHLKRFKSTFIRHFLKYHGLSSQQLTANSRWILLFEGLILGPEFKLPPTNLGCFQLSLEPLQRQLHLLQDGTGDNAEGIGQTHSNIDLSSCSHAFPICPRSIFYFLRPPLSCFFPSAPLSANNKNCYKMASGWWQGAKIRNRITSG